MKTNAPVPGAPDSISRDGLHDIVDAVRIVPWWEWALAAAAGALVLALAAIALYYWWRRRRNRLAPGGPPIPVLPPHERARRELDAALRLLADPDRFCTEVSRILRSYLEGRFGWNAPDRTTEEFLFELGRHPELGDDQRVLLTDFLTGCDLVKFARHNPTETELRGLHGIAVRVVEDTVPPPAPDPVPIAPTEQVPR